MRRLFKVGLDRHDSGKILFSWHPEGNFIASAGKNSFTTQKSQKLAKFTTGRQSRLVLQALSHLNMRPSVLTTASRNP